MTLVRQLKNLQNIKPSKTWQNHTRSILLSQIEGQGVSEQRPAAIWGAWVYTREVANTAYQLTGGWLTARAYEHPGAVVFAVLAIMFGGSAAHFASKDSLPGDALYSVKRTSEQISMAFTPAQDQAAAQINLADKRLSELQGVSQQSISAQDKAQKIQSLINEVGGTLDGVKDNLNNLQKNSDPKQAAKLAALVGEKVKSYDATLDKASVNADPATIKTVADAKTSVDQAGDVALQVMIDKKDAGSVTDAQIADQIDMRLASTEKYLSSLEAKVKAAATKDATVSSHEDAAAQATQEARQSLDAAKESATRKDFKLALNKIQASKDLFARATKELAATNVDSADTMQRRGTVK